MRLPGSAMSAILPPYDHPPYPRDLCPILCGDRPAALVTKAADARYFSSMQDTSTAAADAVRAAIRGIAPVERVRQALAFSETTRAIALSNLRARHPHLTTLELVELMLGEVLIRRDPKARNTP